MLAPSCQRLLIVTLLLPLASSVAQEGRAGDEKKNQSQEVKVDTCKIRQPAQAKDRARRLVGLKADVEASAELVTIEGDETPFLADKIKGRKLWMVTVPDWSVELKSAPDEKDLYRRTLDAVLDPTTGQILKVKTRWPENVPEPEDTIEPDAKTAESHILPEKYYGYPSEPPPISFMEALETEGWGHAALRAKRIDGLWVIWSLTDSKPPRAVWVIMLWCMPPIPAFHAGADVPAYLRENLRVVLDPVKKRGITASQDLHRVPVKKGEPYCENCCSGALTHRAFVESSLDRVRDGEEVESVLAILSCIARRDHVGGYVATGAVRAIFAIAKDEEQIRQHLLDIAAAPETALSVHRTACELLTYVADTETRRVSLELLEGNWSSGNWRGYFQLLTDVGDSAFLAWLETTLRHTPPESRLSVFLERAAKRVRIQEDVEAILAGLESGKGEDVIDAVWLARQAWRHGVSRERIRKAVLSRIRQAGDDFVHLINIVQLVQHCEKLGVFTADDGRDLARVREIAKATNGYRDAPWPPWAEERIALKRAEFYRLNRKEMKDQ